ncbi:hypothetical protein ACE1TF_14580 [Geomicrobium sp. JSM 1781026]|nr:hypothetical protein [Geomicrobium sp. JCM 19037]
MRKNKWFIAFSLLIAMAASCSVEANQNNVNNKQPSEVIELKQ